MQFELATHNKQLNELAENERFATQKIRNDLIETAAKSTFDKAIGDISVMVAGATVEASKKRTAAGDRRVAAAGAILATGMSGNTTRALLTMTKRAELDQTQAANTELALSLAQSKKAKADAIMQRANMLMNKKFQAREYFADPVLGAKKKHYDVAPLPEYKGADIEYGDYIEPPEYLKGVAGPKFIARTAPIKFTKAPPKPVKGPSITEPLYPDKPKEGDPVPQVHVPSGGLGFLDIARAGIAGFSAFDTYRNNALMGAAG